MPAAPAPVWGCIVCYHADAKALRRLIDLLAPQVDRLLVVDNSASAAGAPGFDASPAHYVAMGRNAGTAGAMNEAFRRALAAGAGFLISFDQDSHPAPGLVSCLMQAIRSARVAAVGPVWLDARTGKAMRLLAPVTFLRRHIAAPAQGFTHVDHIISSGCLISAEAFRRVGPFDENLFLDYVDVEWSLRARSLGMGLAVCGGCRMTHAIGEAIIDVAGRQLSVHAPRRSYLQMRNHLLLWRKSHVPAGWLLSDLVQTLGKLGLLMVLAPGRIARLCWIARGIAHGLRGRGGSIPD